MLSDKMRQPTPRAMSSAVGRALTHAGPFSEQKLRPIARRESARAMEHPPKHAVVAVSAEPQGVPMSSGSGNCNSLQLSTSQSWDGLQRRPTNPGNVFEHPPTHQHTPACRQRSGVTPNPHEVCSPAQGGRFFLTESTLFDQVRPNFTQRERETTAECREGGGAKHQNPKRPTSGA